MSGFNPGSIVKMLKNEIPDYIGTYCYKNGTTTPAIAIDNVPNEVQVEGFEIIVPGFPYIAKGVSRVGRRSHVCQIWNVEFINHDSNKIGTLARKGEFFEMINHLILLLPRTTQVIPFQQNDPVKSLQRVRLSIKLSDTVENRLPRIR